jgi:hypothetical protein
MMAAFMISLSDWQKNVVQLLLKCSLMDLDTLGIELVADPKSKLVVPGHRCGKDMVNEYTIIINSVKWQLLSGYLPCSDQWLQLWSPSLSESDGAFLPYQCFNRERLLLDGS